MPRLALVAAALAAGLVTLAARPAAADDKLSAPLAYGALTVELSMTAVTALAFTTPAFTDGPLLAVVGIGTPVLGGGAGYLAYRYDLDPRPVFAIHGAGWAGLDLFMLGALVDGRDQRSGLEIGPAAVTLGAIGVVAGGILGATQVDTADETTAFLAGAPAGFVVGGIGLGGLLVLIGGIDGDKAAGQFATGAVAGMTIGLGVSSYLAITGKRRTLRRATAGLVPSVQPGRDRLMVSLAGPF